MQNQDEIRNLPIDITFLSLGVGLKNVVDRKRIPLDWRKRLTTLREKISTSFVSLPKDIDPFFHTLDLKGLKNLYNKRLELQNSLYSSWPKQETALVKSRELKETM